MKRNKLLTIALTIFILLGYQNCGNINIQRFMVSSYNNSNIQAEFCTTPADNIPSNIKFIFVLDRSASNCVRVPEGSNLGTDAQGVRRFPQIINFLDNYAPQNASMTYYSFINFSSEVDTKKFNNRTDFFINDQSQFRQYVQSQYQPYVNGGCVDAGDTNFHDTLQEVQKQIELDINAAITAHERQNQPIIATNYVVFFISDGSPWVTDTRSGQSTLQGQTMINSDVQNIVDLQNNQIYKDYVDGITINTGLYTQPDPQALYESDPTNPFNLQNEANLAESYLSGMATLGFGTYFRFDDGQVIDFGRFAIPQKINRYQVKDVWIYDANTIWDLSSYSKPYLAPDTDGDGLSDVKEQQLGSNSTVADSDGNGLSDGVEYFLYGQPCFTPGCVGQSVGVPECASFNKNLDPNGPAQMIDTDLDDLNDCEENRLLSKRDNPDTNGDGIPDGLAFHSSIALINASDAAVTDRDFDSITDYQEVKFNTPVNVDNRLFTNLLKVKYNLTQTSTSASQDCYKLEINNLAFQTNNDNIRLYILEQPKAASKHLVFRRAEKQQAFGFIRFNESDFQSFKK